VNMGGNTLKGLSRSFKQLSSICVMDPVGILFLLSPVCVYYIMSLFFLSIFITFAGLSLFVFVIVFMYITDFLSVVLLLYVCNLSRYESINCIIEFKKHFFLFVYLLIVKI